MGEYEDSMKGSSQHLLTEIIIQNFVFKVNYWYNSIDYSIVFFGAVMEIIYIVYVKEVVKCAMKRLIGVIT